MWVYTDPSTGSQCETKSQLKKMSVLEACMGWVWLGLDPSASAPYAFTPAWHMQGLQHCTLLLHPGLQVCLHPVQPIPGMCFASPHRPVAQFSATAEWPPIPSAPHSSVSSSL